MVTRVLLALAVVLLPACERTAENPAADVPAADTTPAVAQPDGAPIGLGGNRAIDLTGDGSSERIVIVAAGPRYDSLAVTLTVETAAGDTLWLDRWNSAMYFRYVQRDDLSAAEVERVVRAEVDSLLHDGNFSARGLPARLRGGSAAFDETIAYHLAELDWRNGASLEPRDPTPPGAHDRIDARRIAPERVRAVRAELEAGPVFSYYAGGEATYAIGWSPREHAFVRLYSCC
jgi:hypothetical protein